MFVCLFVCGISLTSGQLVNELFPDCTRSCFSQVVLRHRGGDRIDEMRCLFVAVGPNARFKLTPGRPVMFRCPSFIVSTMQEETTPIFNVFGMTGPSSNRESNPQILLVSDGSPLSSPFTISRGPHPRSPRGMVMQPSWHSLTQSQVEMVFLPVAGHPFHPPVV